MKSRMKRSVCLAVILGFAGLSTAANPVNQAELFYYGYGSPEISLAGSVGSVDNNAAAGFLNPAGLATIQQLKFASIFGDILGGGAFLSVSSAVPTRRGVLGVNARYFSASATSRLDKAFGGQLS